MTDEKKEGFHLIIEVVFEDNSIYSHDEIFKTAEELFDAYYPYPYDGSRGLKVSYRPFNDTEKWIQSAFNKFCFVYIEKLQSIQGKEVLVLQEPESHMFRDLLAEH